MRPLMMYEPHGGALWLFFRILFWLFIALDIILLIVWLVGQARRHEEFHRLKMRHAQGKISEDEYERMNKISLGRIILWKTICSL